MVRIDAEGEFCGTGFLVAPGQVLTCAHVVRGRKEVVLSNGRWSGAAKALVAVPELDEGEEPSFHPYPDLALLSVAGKPAGMPCVRLDPADPLTGKDADALYVYGYSRGEYEPAAVAASPASVEAVGLVEGAGFQVLKLSNDQILPGFSGSPVLNLRSHAVCGMIDSTRDARSDLGGFAIPASAIAAELPGLLERNREHQSQSRSWGKAEEAEDVAAAEREAAEPLSLLAPRAELDWNPDMPESELLRPRYGVVDLIGRRDLLGKLMLWRESAQPLRVTLLTGGGGVGKTRLALEVCEQALRAGWTAGLLTLDENADPDRELRRVVTWPGRCCIAIDYAEAKPELVSSLIQRLLRRTVGPPMRVILICRQAQSKRELETRFALGEARDEVARVINESNPIALDKHPLDRRLLFEEAVKAFAEKLGKDSPTPPRLSLKGEHFSRVLIVLAAALLVAQDPTVDIDSMNREELLAEVIDRHERQYWQKLAKAVDLDLDPLIQSRAVAAATVLGGNEEAEALAVVGLLPELEGITSERRRKIATWLSNLYGSGNLKEPPVIGPVEPDMLGESLVRAEYSSVQALLEASLDAATNHQLARALTVLSRAAGDSGALADGLRRALDERLPDFAARALTAPELAGPLDLAATTARPAAGAAEVVRRWSSGGGGRGFLSRSLAALAVEHFQAMREAEEPGWAPPLAHSLMLLANFLSTAGRLEEARDAAEASISIRQELLAEDADEHRAALVESLRILIRITDEMVDSEATLAGAVEVVNHARVLCRDDKVEALFLPEALISLSSAWGKLGRHDKAGEAGEEAIEVYRSLEPLDKEGLSQLAAALSNTSVAFGELGRSQAALELAAEAVKLRQSLFDEGEDQSRLPLAIALNNLAVAYSRRGLPDRALEANEEALAQYRQLAEESPRYLSDLGIVLGNLGHRWNAVGQPAKALAFTEEAVNQYRQLSFQNPAAFLPRLASALTNHAVILGSLGKSDEARSVCLEAIAHQRKLVEADRERFLPDLAESLNNISAILGRLELRREALAAIEEVVQHYRELMELDFERYRGDLALSLNNYAIGLGRMGRQEEGLEACEEAIDLYRALVAENPGRYRPELANVLDTCSSQFARLERVDEAIEIDEEACRHYRELAQLYPHRYSHQLAGCLNNLARHLAAGGRKEEALERAEEGLARQRELTLAAPQRFLSELAISLGTYVDVLAELGRNERAQEVLNEVAAEHLESPEGWIPLHVRAVWHEEFGEFEVAVEMAWVAARHKAEEGNPAGKPRLLLRALRRRDPERFDRAWSALVEEPAPVWLRHPEGSEATVDAVLAWINTPTWTESREMLEADREVVASDEGEAVVEHLLDAEPWQKTLARHKHLLQAVRSRGIGEAYDELTEALRDAHRRELLVSWLRLEGEESKAYLEEHAAELVHPQSEQHLLLLAERTDGSSGLLARAGLIGLAAIMGVEKAYGHAADPGMAPLTDADCVGSAADPKILPLTRLLAAIEADDSDRQFQLALAAAADGRATEARQAIERCRSLLSEWDRGGYLRRLDAAFSGDGGGEAGALRELLGAPLSASPDGEGPGSEE